MFKKLKRKLKNTYNYFIDYQYTNLSYSQYGEDLILFNLLPKQKGFYVDIGAHHPKRFSNTYLFYKKGWQGINIDPIPGIKNVFDKIRKRDINLELGVSNKESEMKYYIFNDQALNSFNKELAYKYAQSKNFEIVNTISIKTQKLEDILESYLPNNKAIDFFTIDAEGMDLEILKSNNWKKFRPEILVCEILNQNLEDYPKSAMHNFISAQNYQIVAKGVNTTFYKNLF